MSCCCDGPTQRSVTVLGTVTIGQPVTIADGGGSITVDGTLTVQDGGGSLTVDDGGGSITVDGTVTVQDGGGSISVDDNGGTLSIDDGGGAITVDGTLTVQDGGGSLTVDDGGGSITVDGTVTAVGDVAHDSADSGNPVKIGGKAAQYGVEPTPVAAGDRVNALFDRIGRLFVDTEYPGSTYVHDTITSTTPVDQIAAPGANKAILVLGYSIIAAASNAGTSRITLQFDTAADPFESAIFGAGGGIVRSGKSYLAPTNKKLTTTVGTASRTFDVKVDYKIVDV